MALTLGVLDAPTGKSLHLFLLLLMTDLQFEFIIFFPNLPQRKTTVINAGAYINKSGCVYSVIFLMSWIWRMFLR